MNRLTTDAPKDNIETALNLFYIKDGWTWIRGGGPVPGYEDISLCDFVRKIAGEHKLKMELSSNDCEVSADMEFFDGTDTIEGIVATLYTAGWAFSEIRQRLKAYEDTGLSPDEIKQSAAPPPSAPLTLEELRKMAGQPVLVRTIMLAPFAAPVWVQIVGGGYSSVVRSCGEMFTEFTDGFRLSNDSYGTYWLAYRLKPEETEGKGTAEG